MTSDAPATADDLPVSQIETIVVDPDDIVAAFVRSRRDEHVQRDHVLRVAPPFESEEEATLFVSDHREDDTPEEGPRPLDLGASSFVGEGPGIPDGCSVPKPHLERSEFLRENGHTMGDPVEFDEEMEEAFQEWWEAAMADWEERVREKLVDTVTLRRRTEEGYVEIDIDVRYGETDE